MFVGVGQASESSDTEVASKLGTFEFDLEAERRREVADRLVGATT